MWIAASVYHSLLLFYLPCFMLRHGECFKLKRGGGGGGEGLTPALG